jgi:hypothetical protein
MTIRKPACIRRVDSDRNRTYGWVVRIERRGRVFIRHFSDGVHSRYLGRSGREHCLHQLQNGAGVS